MTEHKWQCITIRQKIRIDFELNIIFMKVIMSHTSYPRLAPLVFFLLTSITSHTSQPFPPLPPPAHTPPLPHYKHITHNHEILPSTLQYFHHKGLLPILMQKMNEYYYPMVLSCVPDYIS